MTARRVRALTVSDLRRQGFTPEQVAALCAADDWSAIEIIKMLKTDFDISLGEGKTIVDQLQSSQTATANDYLRYQAELTLRFPAEATSAEFERFESVTGSTVKLWALVQAGRHAEIAAAIDRFDPNTMSFRPLSIAEARTLVESVLAGWDTEMEILDDRTTEHDFGWTFAAQSSAYVRTGDSLDMVIGHGPFVVDKFTGALWTTSSALSIDEHVANYRASGDPSVSKLDAASDSDLPDG